MIRCAGWASFLLSLCDGTDVLPQFSRELRRRWTRRQIGWSNARLRRSGSWRSRISSMTLRLLLMWVSLSEHFAKSVVTLLCFVFRRRLKPQRSRPFWHKFAGFATIRRPPFDRVPPFDNLLLQAQIRSVSPNFFSVFLCYPCGALI
jgi:hypothetical protein